MFFGLGPTSGLPPPPEKRDRVVNPLKRDLVLFILSQEQVLITSIFSCVRSHTDFEVSGTEGPLRLQVLRVLPGSEL